MDKEATAIGIDVGKLKLDVALIIEGKVRSKLDVCCGSIWYRVPA